MNAERSATPYAAEAPDLPWERIGLATPPWFLRWKLSWIVGDIDEIERRLGDEFGLTETAPLNDEHLALIRQRDALMRRLTNPAGARVD